MFSFDYFMLTLIIVFCYDILTNTIVPNNDYDGIKFNK